MKTIQEVKDFLVAQFPHEKIYLFGSRARGDESIHSDIDIAIEGEGHSAHDSLKHVLHSKSLL